MNSTVQQVAAQRTHVHSTVASNATNIHVSCPNATQRFPDQDLRSQCSMGDDACVYYCRCCGELATDEETSWQADKQKQTPLNFVIAAKSWISGSCLRLLLSRFYYCCSLSAGLKKKEQLKIILGCCEHGSEMRSPD